MYVFHRINVKYIKINSHLPWYIGCLLGKTLHSRTGPLLSLSRTLVFLTFIWSWHVSQLRLLQIISRSLYVWETDTYHFQVQANSITFPSHSYWSITSYNYHTRFEILCSFRELQGNISKECMLYRPPLQIDMFYLVFNDLHINMYSN